MEKKWEHTRFSWDEVLMAEVIITAGRSSCKSIHTGAKIVKNKRIIAGGYNGRAPGFEASCLEEGCEKEARKISNLNALTCLGSHAETNALLQHTAESKEGAIMYTLFSPCYSCAKQIAAAKISEVVFLKKYESEFEPVENYFKRCNIRFRQFKLPKKRLIEVINSVYTQR